MTTFQLIVRVFEAYNLLRDLFLKQLWKFIKYIVIHQHYFDINNNNNIENVSLFNRKPFSKSVGQSRQVLLRFEIIGPILRSGIFSILYDNLTFKSVPNNISTLPALCSVDTD